MAAIHLTKAVLANPPALQGRAKLRLFDSRTKGFIAEVRANLITFYYRYEDPRTSNAALRLGCPLILSRPCRLSDR